MPKATFFNLPEEKRQRIIDAAYEEYLNKPYEKVTVRSLNAKANIPTGCFYKYFDDKDELYLYLWQMIVEKLNLSFITDVLVYSKNSNPREFLTESEIKFTYTFQSVPFEIARRFYFGDNKNKISELYEKVLEKYKENNQLREGVNIKLTAFMYATTSYNLFVYLRENNITSSDERSKISNELYFENFVHGILK